MYTPKKMQLNKFVAVSCPKPKDLFVRLGSREPLGTGSNDGTSYSDVIDFSTSKMSSLREIANEENIRLYEEYRKSQEVIQHEESIQESNE